MKNDWTIYYNPKCGTCRNVLQLLRDNKIEPRLIEYLKTPPSLAGLKEIAEKLGDRWPEMIRTKESEFQELQLALDENSKEDLLKAVVKHPILLQRPIVVHRDKAAVARPPEKVKTLF